MLQIWFIISRVQADDSVNRCFDSAVGTIEGSIEQDFWQKSPNIWLIFMLLGVFQCRRQLQKERWFSNSELSREQWWYIPVESTADDSVNAYPTILSPFDIPMMFDQQMFYLEEQYLFRVNIVSKVSWNEWKLARCILSFSQNCSFSMSGNTMDIFGLLTELLLDFIVFILSCSNCRLLLSHNRC